jgi:ribosomal protein L7/L12
MKHIVEHSNAVVTLRIEIEAGELSTVVHEIMQRANELIETAKNAVSKRHLRLIGFSNWNQKIPCIREVRNHTGLGLKEAKDLVERAPVTILEGDQIQLEPLYRALKIIGADVKIFNGDEMVAVEVMEG